MRAAYRTCRLLLVAKGILSPGESIFEVATERVSGDGLTSRAAIRRDSVLSAVASEVGELPTLVSDDLRPEELQAFATQHLYAALQAGYDPNDECLFWFHAEHIEQFLPKAEHLLQFELELIARAGRRLVKKGRATAFASMQRELGVPSTAERRDWSGLPMAHIRGSLDVSTEDDRTLMVARLEDIARKAQANMDLKTELTAVKLVAQVKGLMFNDLDARNQKALAALLGGATIRSLDNAIVRDSETTKDLKRITG